MRNILAGLTVVLLALIVYGFGGSQAEAGKRCKKNTVQLHDPCGPAPNTKYDGGGHNPTTVRVTVCLPSDIAKAIAGAPDGTWWDFGLYYGSGQPEEVATVRQNCRTQNVAPGTWVVAYINCPPTYQGWVYVKVRKGGTFTLQKGYPFKSRSHDPLA